MSTLTDIYLNSNEKEGERLHLISGGLKLSIKSLHAVINFPRFIYSASFEILRIVMSLLRQQLLRKGEKHLQGLIVMKPREWLEALRHAGSF